MEEGNAAKLAPVFRNVSDSEELVRRAQDELLKYRARSVADSARLLYLALGAFLLACLLVWLLCRMA